MIASAPRAVSDPPPPPDVQGSLFRRHALPWAVALLAHLPGLPGGFVLDDVRAITTHAGVNGQGPLSLVFTRTFWGDALGTPPASWRPLTTLTFALDARLFGLSPGPMHLVSLGWFLALLTVAHRFARDRTSPAAALLAACLFAAMPLHVENVASLVGRADVLALLFGLVALRASRHLARPRGDLRRHRRRAAREGERRQPRRRRGRALLHPRSGETPRDGLAPHLGRR